MKAITYEALGKVRSSRINDPAPAADELLIRVRASGICHTDIDVLHGRYGTPAFPMVAGHEYAGEVVATGDRVSRFAVGDRVVVDPNFHCGVCRSCKKGLTNLCDELGAYGVTRNGGFAELSVVHQDNAVSIAELPYDLAALAEPVGCVLNGLAAVDTSRAENVVIFGAGPIGMLMALALRAQGTDNISLVDIVDSRLELADSFGFKPLAVESDALSSLRRSVDFVADATGVPAVAEGLINYTANGGSMLFFGVCPPGVNIAISPHEVFRRQLLIAGAHSLNHNIPAALDTIAKIGPDIARIISHRVPLPDIAGFLDKGGNRDTLKVQAMLD